MYSFQYTLVLKWVWDVHDKSLVTKKFSRFTNEGFCKYWEAVDRTVRYFDLVVLKKKQKSMVKVPKSALGKD